MDQRMQGLYKSKPSWTRECKDYIDYMQINKCIIYKQIDTFQINRYYAMERYYATIGRK